MTRTGRLARRLERGFTLIELMVVIVILGALIALVGPNVWNALFTSTRKQVEIQERGFKDAIDMYYLEHRALPRTLQDLAAPSERSGEPYMKTIPKDPWDMDYDFAVTDAKKRDYEIRSGGEDKTLGTEDDIVYRTAGDSR